MRPLGKRQRRVVDYLRRGHRLFYEVGPTRSSAKDTVTLGTHERAFVDDLTTSASIELSTDAVCRLVGRRVLVPQGEWPTRNCFDHRRRRVELRLSVAAQVRLT